MSVLAGASIFLAFDALALADDSNGKSKDADAGAKDLTIPGTAGEHNPVVAGKVHSGQTVTLKIGRVLWGGGGSEGSRPVNWHGYPNHKEHNGFPWMALLLGVNHQLYFPDKTEYSFVVREDGDLVIFANDDKSADNTGRGEVTVTISDSPVKTK